jgi:hypothetical protein
MAMTIDDHDFYPFVPVSDMRAEAARLSILMQHCAYFCKFPPPYAVSVIDPL